MQAMILALLMTLIQDKKEDGVLPGGNILSSETYSFHRLLADKKKNLTLEMMPAKFKELGIRGMSLNDIYFKSWDEEYLKKIKGAIEKEGRVVTAFIIDINGDFATEDEKKRNGNVEAVRERLKVAKFLGAPVVRINIGKTGKGDEADGTVGLERVTAAFKSLLPTAKELGVKLAIENHWGCSIKADWVIKIIEGSDPKWVGSCLDFKNWPKGADMYGEIAKLAKYAFHTHAKSHEFGADGEETGCDYARVFKMLKDAGYKGAVSVEWEGDKLGCEEGVAKTRDLILKHWK